MSEHDLGTRYLRLERQGRVAWCRIERPEVRNAISPAMYVGLGRAIAAANNDPDIDALVITGTGDVFIPGGDLGGGEEGPTDVRPSAILPWPAFLASQVPIVTAINGICFASGVMFALLSDVAVASDRATFRVPELVRGVPDLWLAAVLPAHVGVGRARELALTNRKIDATEARAIGLVERVVEHDRLEEAADAAVHEILETAPAARNLVRQAMNARYPTVDLMSMDRAMTGPEVEEGFSAFIEKRPTSWSPRR